MLPNDNELVSPVTPARQIGAIQNVNIAGTTNIDQENVNAISSLVDSLRMQQEIEAPEPDAP